MKTKLAALLPLSVMGLIVFAGGHAMAAENPVKELHKPASEGLLGLMGAVNGLQIPSLSGLIQPEKMGVLTDNESRIVGNESHLLSDNEADVALLSSNQIRILSGLRLFSGITIHVHVTLDARDTKAPKPKKDGAGRGSKKSKKRSAGRKKERSY